jgi:hypothetical protein
MSLLLKIHQIHDCLNVVCDIESDIFDSSLKGLFRKKDYEGNDGSLQVAAGKLVEIHESLKAFHSNQAGIQMVAEDAMNYSYALVVSTVQLMAINKSLEAKANGRAYSMGKYNEDVKLFQEAQQAYMSLGAKLNTDYKLYGYEIAKLEDY